MAATAEAVMLLVLTPNTPAKNVLTGLPLAAVKFTVTWTAFAALVPLPVSAVKVLFVEFQVPSTTAELGSVTGWLFAVFNSAQACALDVAVPVDSPLAPAMDAASATAWAWVCTTHR